MQEALGRMVQRVDNLDLDLLISSVLTSQQVGGNLSDILEVISDTIKDRLRIRAEIRVLTTSGRASGLIIGLLPVFIILILMVINPDYFTSFAESLAGQVMLGVSVALEVLGFLVINRIVNIKY
jgi:tight adherence protein B